MRRESVAVLFGWVDSNYPCRLGLICVGFLFVQVLSFRCVCCLLGVPTSCSHFFLYRVPLKSLPAFLGLDLVGTLILRASIKKILSLGVAFLTLRCWGAPRLPFCAHRSSFARKCYWHPYKQNKKHIYLWLWKKHALATEWVVDN